MMDQNRDSSPLSKFLKEMRITSSEFRIVADNPRTIAVSLLQRRMPIVMLTDATQESQRWLAAADNVLQRPVQIRTSFFEEVWKIEQSDKFSKTPLRRFHSDQMNPPYLPRRKESYDADEDATTRPPVPRRNFRSRRLLAPKSDDDMSPSKPTRRYSGEFSISTPWQKPLKAKAARQKPLKAKAA